MNYRTLAEQFAAPDARFRPMPFWIWNGTITREGIAEQIADFAAKGVGGFFFHPMGESFRLDDFVAGITPPYLSDEYFSLVRYAVERARDHGLYAWLYDEGGWPSGSAQGQVTAGHPEFAGKRLHVRRVGAEQADNLPTNIIAALGLPEMGVPMPVELREIAQTLWPYPEMLVFTLESDGYPIDVLSPPAVRRFLDVTHERYAATVGEFFGNTIPGIFTDETALGGRAGAAAIPWTGDFMEALGEQMGRDVRLYLPLLFSAEAVGRDVLGRYSEHETTAARCEYYDLLTQRFSEAYWQQITAWCADHGLLHTGHVGGEDNLPDSLSFGHFFRTAGALHAPGVDVIWRQLFPGQESNFPFPRFAQSALQQRPREADGPWSNMAITESNAVYGFGFQYAQMRWLADYQFQGGISLYVPMASHYTCEGGRLYCTLSHMGPGNPLWTVYGAFAAYIGRMCALTRQTAEQAPVALYYPVEALWTLDGAQEAWTSLREAGLTLTSLQIAFDFLDADFLATLETRDGRACGGQAAYREIVVPAALAMSAQSLGKLAQLAEGGVTVRFLEHWPLHAAEMTGSPALQTALNTFEDLGLAPLPQGDLETELAEAPLHDRCVRLADPEPALLLSAREAGPARLYLLTNDSDRVLEPFLLIQTPDAMVLEAWDARDGEIVPLLQTAGGVTAELRPVLPAWSSLVLCLRPPADGDPALAPLEESAAEREFTLWLADPERRQERVPHADVLVEFRQADAVRIVDEYVIREGNVDINVDAEPRHPYVDGPAELLLWNEWGMPEFSGHVEYAFEFTISPHFVNKALLLDLGAVYWTASVFLNDRHLGDCPWMPYTLDLTGQVAAGTNRLRVVVGNTLANQACEASVLQEAQDRGWYNTYLQRAVPMMKEDLRGGLAGPVRVIVGTLQPD